MNTAHVVMHFALMVALIVKTATVSSWARYFVYGPQGWARWAEIEALVAFNSTWDMIISVLIIMSLAA